MEEKKVPITYYNFIDTYKEAVILTSDVWRTANRPIAHDCILKVDIVIDTDIMPGSVMKPDITDEVQTDRVFNMKTSCAILVKFTIEYASIASEGLQAHSYMTLIVEDLPERAKSLTRRHLVSAITKKSLQKPMEDYFQNLINLASSHIHAFEYINKEKCDEVILTEDTETVITSGDTSSISNSN